MGPETYPMTYKDLSNFELNQFLMKVANTPMSTAKAIVIRKVIAHIQKLRERVHAEYKAEIYDTYFQKDEKGQLKLDENQQPMPVEGKEDEIKAKTDEFGKRIVQVEQRFRPSMLSDMKQVSPREVEVLGELLAEEDGPGIPSGAEFTSPTTGLNVRELRN